MGGTLHTNTEIGIPSKKRCPACRWRLDKTSLHVRGTWTYLNRIDKRAGQTIDFLLAHRRDKKAVLRFSNKTIKKSGNPNLTKIDKSGVNTVASQTFNQYFKCQNSQQYPARGLLFYQKTE